MRISNLILLLVICSFVLISSVWAGPPFVTDDPEPLEPQHWEVNYAISKSWREGEASAAIPNIDINYGAVPNIQLHIQPRFSYEKTRVSSQFGIDDTEVGVKYRFVNIQRDDFSLMVGTYPMLQLPTGYKRLGENRNKVQSFIPLWMQTDINKCTIYGGLGYRLNPGAGNKNSTFVGVATMYEVSPKFQLGGEVFHESANSEGGLDTAGFNLGGDYNLVKDNNILFSMGKGLKNANSTNELSAYLALQVLY